MQFLPQNRLDLTQNVLLPPRNQQVNNNNNNNNNNVLRTALYLAQGEKVVPKVSKRLPYYE